MIFEEKYLPLNVLLTEQIPLPGSGCFYFEVICFRNYLLSRYWHHKIWDNLSIQVYMTKKLRQKFWYLDKKKSTTILVLLHFRTRPPPPLPPRVRVKATVVKAFSCVFSWVINSNRRRGYKNAIAPQFLCFGRWKSDFESFL